MRFLTDTTDFPCRLTWDSHTTRSDYCQQGGMEGEQSTWGGEGAQKVDEDTRRTLKKRCLPVAPFLSLRSVQSHSFLLCNWGGSWGETHFWQCQQIWPWPCSTPPPPDTQKGSWFQWGPTDATSTAEQGSWVCHIPKQWKWESQEFWQSEPLISSLREA